MIEVTLAIVIAGVVLYLLLPSASSDAGVDALEPEYGSGADAPGSAPGLDSLPSSAPAVPGINVSEKVRLFADAIAFAEGFGIPGSVPTRANNPGDLGPADTPGYKEVINAVGSQVTILPNAAIGWSFLYRKLQRIFDGRSDVYSVNMTIIAMAQKYAADWRSWAKNVSQYLGVPATITLREWLAL